MESTVYVLGESSSTESREWRLNQGNGLSPTGIALYPPYRCCPALGCRQSLNPRIPIRDMHSTPAAVSRLSIESSVKSRELKCFVRVYVNPWWQSPAQLSRIHPESGQNQNPVKKSGRVSHPATYACSRTALEYCRGIPSPSGRVGESSGQSPAQLSKNHPRSGFLHERMNSG